MFRKKPKYFYKSYDNKSLIAGRCCDGPFYIEVDGKLKKVSHEDWCKYQKYHTIEDTIYKDGKDITEDIFGYALFKHKIVLFDDVMNMFYGEFPQLYKNHYIEELKMSVRIAKDNVAVDPGNKYYASQLQIAEKKLANEL